MTSFVRLQDTIVRVDRIVKVYKYSASGDKPHGICIRLTDDGKSEEYSLEVNGSYKTTEERDKDFDRIANELTRHTTPKVELQRAPVSTFGPTSSSGIDKGFFTGN